jgi:hypothetical protein
MTDHRPDHGTGSPPVPSSDPDAANGADEAAGEPGAAVERRAFLRQLSGEAIVTTARLAGLTSVVRRTIYAAGQSATRDLVPPADVGTDPGSTAADAPSPGEGSTVAPPPASDARADPSTDTAPPVSLTPDQDDLLRRAETAILGVNARAGAPHLTSSIFHWDGSVIRLPSELFAARVAHIEADPQVSVLVQVTAPDAWVAITGVASVVSGAPVEAEMLTILGKYLADDAAGQHWAELRASGDRVVIRVQPTRFVWRLD